LPAPLRASAASRWSSIVEDIQNDTNFLDYEDSARFDCLELLSPYVPDGEVEVSVKVSEWLNACWRMCCLNKALQAKGHDASERSPSGQHTETACRELMRATQRVEQAGAQRLLTEKAAKLASRVEDEVSSSKALIAKKGGEIRDAVKDKVTAGISELKALMEKDLGYTSWQGGKAKLDSIAGAIELFEQGLDKSACKDWLAKCSAVQASLHMLAQKSNEFNLEKGDSTPNGDDTEFLKRARALCLVQDMLAAFSNPAVNRDKIALRTRMLKVQSKLKEFEITPDFIEDVVLEKYRSALKMR